MKRNLTDEDIKMLVDALRVDAAEGTHQCRFNQMNPNDLAEAVKFYKHFNQIMAEGGKTTRAAILVLSIGSLFTLLGIGIISKLKTPLGP